MQPPNFQIGPCKEERPGLDTGSDSLDGRLVGQLIGGGPRAEAGTHL